MFFEFIFLFLFIHNFTVCLKAKETSIYEFIKLVFYYPLTNYQYEKNQFICCSNYSFNIHFPKTTTIKHFQSMSKFYF
jgi:hypothetical protein